MHKRFTYGFLSGISAIMLAFPVVAQVSNAQSGTALNAAANPMRPAPSRERVQQMIDHDDAFLTNVDALIAVQKTAVAAHRDALLTAQSIADETARQSAVKAADETFRAAMRAAFSAHPELKRGMPLFGGKDRHHWFGPADLARKLGMTEDDLKSALEEGKTFEELAEEKGIELPMKGRRMFMKTGSSSSHGKS